MRFYAQFASFPMYFPKFIGNIPHCWLIVELFHTEMFCGKQKRYSMSKLFPTAGFSRVVGF